MLPATKRDHTWLRHTAVRHSYYQPGVAILDSPLAQYSGLIA